LLGASGETSAHPVGTTALGVAKSCLWRISKNALLKWLDNGGNGNGNGHQDQDIDRVLESGDKQAISKMLKTSKVKAGKGD
jgi:hypothetical protein